MNEEDVNIAREMLEQKINSLEYYYSIYDELSGERDDLHDRIIHSIISANKYSSGKQIFMLGGAPANGKSTFLNSGNHPYPKNAIRIDPDEIKEKLPEYVIMMDMHASEAAALVHEESSFIAREILNIAIQKGFDIIIDGVANDTLETRLEQIAGLRSNGHYIRMDYVTLDTELSIKLAEQRFRDTGRGIPPTYLIEKNQMIAKLVPELIESKAFNELYLWDTNMKDQPRLILSQKSGKLKIENEALYEDFKRKAND